MIEIRQSTDPDAPTLTPTAGSFTSWVKKVFIEGYGSFGGLGFIERESTDTRIALSAPGDVYGVLSLMESAGSGTTYSAIVNHRMTAVSWAHTSDSPTLQHITYGAGGRAATWAVFKGDRGVFCVFGNPVTPNTPSLQQAYEFMFFGRSALDTPQPLVGGGVFLFRSLGDMKGVTSHFLRGLEQTEKSTLATPGALGFVTTTQFSSDAGVLGIQRMSPIDWRVGANRVGVLPGAYSALDGVMAPTNIPFSFVSNMPGRTFRSFTFRPPASDSGVESLMGYPLVIDTTGPW